MLPTRRLAVLSLLLPACGPRFEVVAEDENEGLLAITGTAADDVYVVGADKGHGPAFLHYDGDAWERLSTGTSGDLWWGQAMSDGSAWFGGANATVLRYDGGAFERMETPGAAHQTVYGVWSDGQDVWAVGGHAGRNGFVWRYDGVGWEDMLLPLDIPRRADGELPTLLKVWGDGEGAVWIVGSEGTILLSDGGGALENVPSPTTATLFTVNGFGDDLVAVGSEGSGVVLERGDDGEWLDVTPESTPALQGVCLAPGGHGIATGADGAILVKRGRRWVVDEKAPALAVASLHAAWIDPDGGWWAVGGNVTTPDLDAGILVHAGRPVEVLEPVDDPDEPGPPTCPADAIDLSGGHSVARGWNEQLLNAVRRDVPRPGVHARNLFHTSVAMWDAWAAYDDVADGYLVADKATADDVEAAREEAISYAAHRVLEHRYATAIGGPTSTACFDAYMEHLGYDPDDDTTTGDTPRALGNRIGQAVIDAYAGDGANEAANYADTTGWTSVNPPITVDSAAIDIVDPDAWTPLNLAVAVTQNGIVTDAGVQKYIGSNWGAVTPFALVRPAPDEVYLQPVAEPKFADADMDDQVMEVVRKTAWLDPEDPTTIDISPGAFGNNPLGTNDGTGHPTNPATGQPYAPNVVPRADFARVLAEFWADGPKSETPPGHWNTLANDVVDAPQFERRLFGTGEALDPLAWDVAMYLALNGAVHDAAIAAWELKREYLASRPIQLIRYKATLGQSSDPTGPSYDPEGLPLEAGLVEVITEESAAPGERHEHLRHFVGEVAIYTWRGEPGDRAHDVGGHAWVRGTEWIPYQRRTFVTPAFPGFVSGHSTFSSAGAEALTEITGSPWFPGGLGEFVAAKDAYLVFEDGPAVEVRLQWGTYQDAADQAGQSRLWGGIHIWPDDTAGRQMGHEIGVAAVAKARTYYEGTARP